MWRRIALIAAVCGAAACSGGAHASSSASTAVSPTADKAAHEAARACRMWSEVTGKVKPGTTPNYPALDAAAAAIGPVANQASTDDPRWNQLALDVAPATDFKSAAIADQNIQIAADCRKVPAAAVKAVAGEADPYSTTSTTTP